MYTSRPSSSSQLQFAVNWMPNRRNRRSEGWPAGSLSPERMVAMSVAWTASTNQDEVEHDQNHQQRAVDEHDASEIGANGRVLLTVSRKWLWCRTRRGARHAGGARRGYRARGARGRLGQHLGRAVE